MAKSDTSALVLEACVETLEQALLAEKCGAHRIELCADLKVGGLTPPVDLVKAAVAVLKIPVMVMVRPREGNFVYTSDELETMKQSITNFKKAGVTGVVFGVLDEENEIDLEQTLSLATLAKQLQVTFHKAIDETPDPARSTRLISALGCVDRILSSGGASSALAGREKLKEMIGIAALKGSLKILVGGGVTKENLLEVHHTIGADEYHGRRIVF